MTGFGSLACDPSAPRDQVAGHPLSPDLPTRVEEFTWALGQVKRLAPLGALVLDAGTGTDSRYHIFSELLGEAGFRVLAIDHDKDTLTLPTCTGVVRLVADMFTLSHIGPNTVDAYTTISVVEHMGGPDARVSVWTAAFRVLRPGGWVVVTADDIPPQQLANEMALAGFMVGGEIPFEGQSLTPRVSWAIARKPQ